MLSPNANLPTSLEGRREATIAGDLPATRALHLGAVGSVLLVDREAQAQRSTGQRALCDAR
jgi:hypothetical protein